MKFTSKQVTTIIVSVAAVFIVMAVFTLVVGEDENESESTSTNTESSIQRQPNWIQPIIWLQTR